MESTLFNLITSPDGVDEQIVCKNVISPTFEFPNDAFNLQIDTTGYGGEENAKRCLDLDSQLAKELERDKWELILKLQFTTESVAERDNYGGCVMEDIITSVNATVKGEFLKCLHSVMAYGVNGAWPYIFFGISLNAVMRGRAGDPSPPQSIQCCFETSLKPRKNENGSFEHGEYVASDQVFRNASRMMRGVKRVEVDLKRVLKWELSSILLRVSGASSKMYFVEESHAIEVNKRILESGLGADVQIMGKNGVVIPCHSSVLIVQSPVIAGQLTGGAPDASSRILRMEDKSKEELDAFLEYIYYGSKKKAFAHAKIATALYRMGRHYLVQKLERAMKDILLTQRDDWLSIEDVLQMYQIGKDFEEAIFQRRAVDILAAKGDAEIKACTMFQTVFKDVPSRRQFLSSRKRFF